MALNKKQISYLLVAVLAGGTIIGESIGLYNLNNTVEELQQQNIKLERTIDSLNKNVKEKDATIDNVTKERDNNKDSLDKLQEENKVLNKKLEAKKKEEAAAVQMASADSPTQSISRGRSVGRGTPVQVTLTFYGGGAEENGGYAGMNAYSQKLQPGMVASNVYARGTKFQTPDGHILDVQDRGGKNFNSYNRLDVYVPRHSGESKASYDARIAKLGRKTVTLYKL